MSSKEYIDELWGKIAHKIKISSKKYGDTFPYIMQKEEYQDYHDIYWWTNGFWPGIMWLMYLQTTDDAYKKIAQSCEVKLDEALYGFDGLHHDVGFMWILSSLAHYKITKCKQSRKRALIAASILTSRFNLNGRYIRAWNDDHAGYAIIDSMMNIPLLYWASEELNDVRFKSIAMAHADTILENFLRQDNSVHHIVNFDSESGSVIDFPRGQGYESGSSWSRGQAWAIYGFTLSYAHTKEKRFLDTAVAIANYFIGNIADDYVPNCDFASPKMPIIKDTSAGAIAASGLVELAKYVGEQDSKQYLEIALKIIQALDNGYGLWDNESDAILCGAAVQYHSTEHNASIIYGDYFFMEAVLKLRNNIEIFW